MDTKGRLLERVPAFIIYLLNGLKGSHHQSWLPSWIAPGHWWFTQKPVQSMVITAPRLLPMEWWAVLVRVTFPIAAGHVLIVCLISPVVRRRAISMSLIMAFSYHISSSPSSHTCLGPALPVEMSLSSNLIIAFNSSVTQQSPTTLWKLLTRILRIVYIKWMNHNILDCQRSWGHSSFP